jgi:hypothetical protein
MFGKKNRRFKSATERQNAMGPAPTADQAMALRIQSSHVRGQSRLSDQERAFVQGTAEQDQDHVRKVIKNVRKANRKK